MAPSLDVLASSTEEVTVGLGSLASVLSVARAISSVTGSTTTTDAAWTAGTLLHRRSGDFSCTSLASVPQPWSGNTFGNPASTDQQHGAIEKG